MSMISCWMVKFVECIYLVSCLEEVVGNTWSIHKGAFNRVTHQYINYQSHTYDIHPPTKKKNKILLMYIMMMISLSLFTHLLIHAHVYLHKHK
jgi:hypothetical protein